MEELEKQGVDFEQEGNTIIIDGSHIYDFEEGSNGEVSWENQGTTAMPKPKVDDIKILEQTNTTITVQVTTKRNIGGTLIYYIQEEDGEYQKIEEKAQTATEDPAEEPEYIFTIDDPDKIYSKIKVEAIAKNGETASKEVDIVGIPALTKKDVTFTYSENNYTKGPVTVTVKVNTKNVDTTGYILQYTTGDPKVSSNWKEYTTAGVEFTSNGNLYVRLSDGKQGGRYATGMVNNIDTLGPKQFTPTVTSEIDRITVTGSTTDQETTATSASSGIDKYYFSISKDNGNTWGTEQEVKAEEGKEATYTFSDLMPDNTFKLKMKAVDKVGNETTTEIVEKKTTKLEIGFQYPTNWTKDTITVTVTTKPENLVEKGYTVEYSKDGSNWSAYSTGVVTMDTNGAVHARVKNAKGTELRKCNSQYRQHR